MGLFGRKTWSEKIAKAFNTFNDEAKPLLFPKGAAEAEEVASAIANCCGVDVAKCNQKQAEELLNIYAEVAAGKLISNQPRDVIVANLLKNYEKTIRSAGMADRICNYCEKVLSKGDAEVEPEAPVIFDEEPAEEPAEEVAEEEPAEEVVEEVAEEAAEEEPEAEEEEAEEEEAEVTEEVVAEEEPSEEEPAEEAAEEATKEIPEAVQAARKGLKKLVKKFELDGKGRKAMADAMKDTRKSLVKGVMKECGEDGATAVKAAFCAAMAATEAYKVDDKVFEESEKSAWKVLKKDLGMNPERLIFQAESDKETAELLTALVKKTGAEGWADMSEDVRKDVLKAVCTVGFKKAAK